MIDGRISVYHRPSTIAGLPSTIYHLLLMPECPAPREHHRDPGFVRCGDHLIITHRAAGLDDRSYPCGGGLLHAVAEGEEGVGAEGGAGGVVAHAAGLVDREEGRVHAGHLA